MSDKLRLNTALYGGFEGIIGRRDYFLNQLYILSISMLFTLPYYIWYGINMETFSDVFNPLKMFMLAPWILNLFLIAGIVIVGLLNASNIYRRMNDINGEVKNEINLTCSIFVVSASLVYFFVSFISFSVYLISCIIGLVLLFKKGKITSKYPYDFTKEFNWGAFLGTWIWGLVNKSYVTLLYFLFATTPWSFIFSLYCGLKGNEWAYKNKGWNDVAKFNKSQEKQTTIFAIIFALVIPVLYFLVIGLVIALIALAVGFTDVSKTDGATFNETKTEKIEYISKGLDNAIEKLGSIYFDSYDITESENKFYLSASDWASYSFTEKRDILKTAASIASTYKNDKFKNKSEYFSGRTELPKTKIYSEAGQLLGEYVIDNTEGSSFKEIFKSALNAYRFYNPDRVQYEN